MARRRVKKRTHVGANGASGLGVHNGGRTALDPKSMVIRIGAGDIGSSLSKLASDVRRVMEPGTASRLKERRANRLRDYVTMCGPLGVTHLLLFSRSQSGNPNLRGPGAKGTDSALSNRELLAQQGHPTISETPKGQRKGVYYSSSGKQRLMGRSSSTSEGGTNQWTKLVMNNLTNPSSDAKSKVPRHLESLVTTVFQSLFPAINPQTTPLKSIKRVLLLNREPPPSGDMDDGFTLNFRHYVITTKKSGDLSRASRRLDAAGKMLSSSRAGKGGLPNLGKLQDIADYMVGGEDGEGYMTEGTSGSEMDTDAEVEVLNDPPKKLANPKAKAAVVEEDEEQRQPTPEREENVERLAVKLVDLGPRMRLRLTKVEEGLCSGKVMWHEYLHKSKEELRALDQKWEQRKKEREARKQLQKENVDKKRKAKSAQKGGAGEQGDREEEATASEDDEDAELFSDMDDDLFDSEGLEGDAENRSMPAW